MGNKNLRENIISALKSVEDPEISADIYELGLIYGIDIDDASNVEITMTLTTPNCPVAENIVQDVFVKVNEIPGVKDVDIHLTFEPPWHQDMASELAKLQMGLL